MMEHIQHLLDRTIDGTSAKAHVLLSRLTRLAGSAGLFITLLLLASVGFLALAAAIVVALAERLGVAEALAIVGGCLLLIGSVAAAMIWGFLSRPEPKLEAITISTPANNAPTHELQVHTANPQLPQSPSNPSLPSPSPLANLPKVDPIFVVASLGAAAAIFGPARLLRLLGTVTAGVSVAKNLAPLADALHKYNSLHAINDLLGPPSSRPSSPANRL